MMMMVTYPTMSNVYHRQTKRIPSGYFILDNVAVLV